MRFFCSHSVIKFVPDPLIGEHVNLGVVVQGPGREPRIELPSSLRNSKVDRWWPKTDLVMLQAYVMALAEKLPSALRERPLEEVVAGFSQGMVMFTPPERGISFKPLDEYAIDLKKRYVDLRFQTGGPSFRSATSIKRTLRASLEKKGLVGTKVELEPEEVKADVFSFPARPDLRWLNGKSQYVWIYSADQSEKATKKASDPLWDASKALLMDCETIQSAGAIPSVIFQNAERPQGGEFREISTLTREKLKRAKVKIFEADDLSGFIEVVSKGRDLPRLQLGE